jgi:sodium transport system ATP-binding protein
LNQSDTGFHLDGITGVAKIASLMAKNADVFGRFNSDGFRTIDKVTGTTIPSTSIDPTIFKYSEMCELIPATDSRAVRNKIGFLTGEMRLTGQLTARELLIYFGQLDHMDNDYINKRMKELSNDLELTAHLDVPIAKLSSGLTQKVSIAVALLNEPHIIIFDEPTTNLDVMATKIVSDFIRDAKDNGKCVLLSTHVLSDAQRLCDRIGIMYEGHLLCEGPLDELLEQYKVKDLEQLFFSLVSGDVK